MSTHIKERCRCGLKLHKLRPTETLAMTPSAADVCATLRCREGYRGHEPFSGSPVAGTRIQVEGGRHQSIEQASQTCHPPVLYSITGNTDAETCHSESFSTLKRVVIGRTEQIWLPCCVRSQQRDGRSSPHGDATESLPVAEMCEGQRIK